MSREALQGLCWPQPVPIPAPGTKGLTGEGSALFTCLCQRLLGWFEVLQHKQSLHLGTTLAFEGLCVELSPGFARIPPTSDGMMLLGNLSHVHASAGCFCHVPVPRSSVLVPPMQGVTPQCSPSLGASLTFTSSKGSSQSLLRQVKAISPCPVPGRLKDDVVQV